MNDRTCIVTRQSEPAEAMIRFVALPDGVLVPDVKGNLPGRGAWIKASRAILQEALRRKAFERNLKCDVIISDGLTELVDQLLLKNALQSLSLARKAGLVVSNGQKVVEAIRMGKVAMVLHAAEAAEDGKRKIAQAIFAAKEQEKENVPVISSFTGDDLSLAFGDTHVIHVGVLKGAGAKSFTQRAQKLLSYRDKTD